MAKNTIKNTKNNDAYVLGATILGGAAAFWLVICTIAWFADEDKNQIGKLTDFEKPKVNVYTGKPITKYANIGLDVTGDNEADVFTTVRKWDNNIKVGDTVKLSSPFLKMPLHEIFRQKMEKVR